MTIREASFVPPSRIQGAVAGVSAALVTPHLPPILVAAPGEVYSEAIAPNSRRSWQEGTSRAQLISRSAR